MRPRRLWEVLGFGRTPQPGEEAPDGESAWRNALELVLTSGQEVSPRGMRTKELLHSQLVSVDMTKAVVTSPERKLSYQFMAAEALWIATGRNDLAYLLPYAPSYGRFSDDGVTMAGAYGPKIASQIDYVVNQLKKDRDTRQAALTIWERNPAPSKDIPCTMDMVFSIRQGKLHLHVHMRSSDTWLGVPYDIFSFSVVGLKVACLYNAPWRGPAGEPDLGPPVGLGTLTVNMTSSHLYEKDWARAEAILDSPMPEPVEPIRSSLVGNGRWADVEVSLNAVREGKSNEIWDPRPEWAR